MCCDSIFTCIMTMIFDFSIIFIFTKLVLGFVFLKYNILLRFDLVLILLLLTVTFFSFQNHLYFLRVALKKYKTFSYNLFNNIKHDCFLYDQITKLLTSVEIVQYLQRICSPIFVVEEFSGLFVHPSIFLIKGTMSA